MDVTTAKAWLWLFFPLLALIVIALWIYLVFTRSAGADLTITFLGVHIILSMRTMDAKGLPQMRSTGGAPRSSPKAKAASKEL
jgi:amino acid permease